MWRNGSNDNEPGRAEKNSVPYEKLLKEIIVSLA